MSVIKLVQLKTDAITDHERNFDLLECHSWQRREVFNSVLGPTPTARNLHVTLDSQHSLTADITETTRSCRYMLHNIRRIRPLRHRFLDDCNSLLAGLPAKAIQPLQLIQNAATQLVFNLPKFTHTTPLLRSLHWLPVASRIRFKTLVLAYRAANGSGHLHPGHGQALQPQHVHSARQQPIDLWLHHFELIMHSKKSRLFAVLAPSVVEWAPHWHQQKVSTSSAGN